MATSWGSVEAIPAPDIRFLALVQFDSSHVFPVTSPVSGVLVLIAPERHARRGARLAVVREGWQVTGREVPVMSAEEGTWHPRPPHTTVFLQGDTLGLVQEHGYWLAVGTLSNIDIGVIHQGDSALVQIGGDPHTMGPGKVAQVRQSGVDSSYSADVTVKFRAPEAAFVGWHRPVSVVVTAASPADSVPAVPDSAVVQLAPGPAVFVPVGLGTYQVRWISTGPSVHGMVVVREGVTSGTSVVVGGLGPLVEAARDSLSQKPLK